MARAELGVFGGSGFYSFLEGAEEVEVSTPYGKPSAPIVVGEVAGTLVAFLPRHGRDHELPPHAINYRANVWALKEIGVRRILGPCASGALSRELDRGDFVVCDQFVDRTGGRADTFYDGPETTHVSSAEPYCPDLRRLLVETARELDIPVRDGGTVVVTQGAPLLDARRVAVVRTGGVGRDQHDRLSRGPSGPGAGSSSSATPTSRW